MLSFPLFFAFCFLVWYIVPPPLSLWLLVTGGFCRQGVARLFASKGFWMSEMCSKDE
jgi:hypothetical protein